MAETIKMKIEADTKQATDGVNDLGDGIENTSTLTSDLTNKLDQMTGGLITGLRGAVTGIKSAVMGFKSLKVAIAATGIGALVIAFASLASFFTRTQRGADKVNVVFKTLGATVDVLIDRVSAFGEGLFKIITGDVKEGFTMLKESISGVTDEIKREGEAAGELEKAQQALRDREIEFIKIQAKKKQEIEQARLAAEDEALSNEERATALREAIRIQNELTNEQIEIEEERARIIRERVALGESMSGDMEEQARAEARVIELQTERDRRLRSIQTRLNAFTETQTETTTRQVDNVERINMAEMGRLETNTNVNREIQTNNQATLDNLDEAYDESVEFRKQKEEELKQARLAALNAGFSAAQNGLGNLAVLFEGNAKAQKNISIAEATISTFQGAVSAYNAAQLIPPPFGQIIGAANAATAIAAGFAQIRKIKSTNVSASGTGSGGGGGSFGGGGGSSFSSFGGADTPTIGSIPTFTNTPPPINGSDSEPIRAFVVEDDISTAQNSAKALQRRTIL